MTQAVPASPPVNPFSTRFIQPGAISFVFPEGTTAQSLVERLRVSGWWGQIVGAHGSGKSTLLATLDPLLREAGRTPLVIALHDGQRRLPISLARRPDLDATTLVVIDGYEQLSRTSRWFLKRRCRRQQWGLVVTAHQSVGLPELFETQTNLPLAREIVERLLANQQTGMRGDDITRAFEKHDGNLRDTLFDLYDLVEQRRHRRSGGRRAADRD